MMPALLMHLMLTLTSVAAPLEWCDTTALHPCEGVWRFTDDAVDVTIRRERDSSRFCIEVLSSADGRLIPGDTLGFIIPTSDPKKGELRLNTRRDSSGRLTHPQTCTAQIDETDGTIAIIRPPKRWNVRINPLALLPGLSRIVQVRSRSNGDKLHHGLIRLYPSYDGNGSSTLSPRYL